MTEDQAIVWIGNAMFRATADDMGAAYIPAGLLTNEQWEALSHAAWNEMKAIAIENRAYLGLITCNCGQGDPVRCPQGHIGSQARCSIPA